ncbi:MAG: SoxR reducing system RseC family protein [Gammaproteobacteria bacterium]|nr:SoxR reducing system RseC family protein [Rhodocyclaceae bacterium]MBU3907913.1 SoxR reducing system RseC family protein [Gammaproteobacteria bacterium]MBU3989614.1 SoxR reducing system RseC family protein [Gammaproteobacteria bacterium]MBU4003819.1 SoxR reducing system RseC family protein [Gammaproteobacteria bacterium]MBU4021697.1 SoxR reducing system RseC family protein [Gammaproteobacteria bacterium]
MTETNGVVVRLEGDHAWVRAEGAGSACGSCGQKGGCQSVGMGSVLDGLPGSQQTTRLLYLPNTIHARQGDVVVICASEGALLRAVWLAYGIPLLLALAGAIALSWLTGSEVAAAAGMVAGLLGGFFFMRHRGFKCLDPNRTEPILSINFKHTT